MSYARSPRLLVSTTMGTILCMSYIIGLYPSLVPIRGDRLIPSPNKETRLRYWGCRGARRARPVSLSLAGTPAGSRDRSVPPASHRDHRSYNATGVRLMAAEP